MKPNSVFLITTTNLSRFFHDKIIEHFVKEMFLQLLLNSFHL